MVTMRSPSQSPKQRGGPAPAAGAANTVGHASSHTRAQPVLVMLTAYASQFVGRKVKASTDEKKMTGFFSAARLNMWLHSAVR